MRAQRRTSAVFKDSLDICKLVDDRFKLNLLIDTLLTSHQKFLFFNQSSKVVHLDPGPKSHLSAASHSIWEQDERYSSKKVSKEAMMQMLGFTAKNPLERKLLLGVLPPIYKQRSHHNEFFNQTQAS